MSFVPQYLRSKIVIVADRGFGEDSLYVATNLSDALKVLEICGHWMRIEESFRDFKNENYFALREARLKGIVKMEKLILAVVIAYMFVILFGVISEGMKEFVDLVSVGFSISKNYVR